MFIRAFTAAHIELWSNSSPFVQLQCFQMRGGSRCLVLNLNLSFIFEKTKSFCTFLPHLKAFLHIRNTFLRVHMAFKELFFCFFFFTLFIAMLCVSPIELGAGGWGRRKDSWALCTQREQQFRTGGAVHA